MDTHNLRLSKCCGSCIHCNKPKNPSGHIAHYDVAKTQRWCYNNNCYTTRECVCDCYEPISKGGSVSSSKRVFRFNRRLQRILDVIERMKELSITELKLYDNSDESIFLANNKLYHSYSKLPFSGGYCFKGNDSDFDRYEEIIYEKIKKQNSYK